MDTGATKPGTITLKQVLLFLVLPVCLSAALLALAFYLKHQEMIRYQSPGLRIAAIIIAAITGPLSIFLFWMAVQVKFLRALRADYTSKKPTASLVISLGTLLVILPIIFIGFRLKQFNDSIEEKALAAHGIKTRAVVTGFKKVRRKYNDHYKIYLRFRNLAGTTVEETIKQKQLLLKTGDTISIVYLDINPGIFRVAE